MSRDGPSVPKLQVMQGATVEQRPIISDQSGTTDQHKHTPYDITDLAPMCSRLGCDRAATITWAEGTTGASLAYCPEDGVEALNLITRWLGEPEQRIMMENYAIAVEQAAGRGLYEQPMRARFPSRP